MDLKEIKKIADQSYDSAMAKKNALEKAQSNQVLAYNNHIFNADAITINLVKTLMQDRDRFFMLDANQNPVEIIDANDFLDLLIQKNQQALNEYHRLYKTLQKRI